eukprot:m.86964 g.86964  ORF g.86964 m.86964 type:complete len:166 (+) comp13080_c0_seq2:321-818(+)
MHPLFVGGSASATVPVLSIVWVICTLLAVLVATLTSCSFLGRKRKDSHDITENTEGVGKIFRNPTFSKKSRGARKPGGVFADDVQMPRPRVNTFHDARPIEARLGDLANDLNKEPRIKTPSVILEANIKKIYPQKRKLDPTQLAQGQLIRAMYMTELLGSIVMGM